MIKITTSAGFYNARRSLGLSVTQAAAFVNVDERTLRRWENEPERGPHPSACRLLELAHGLLTPFQIQAIIRGEW